MIIAELRDPRNAIRNRFRALRRACSACRANDCKLGDFRGDTVETVLMAALDCGDVTVMWGLIPPIDLAEVI